MAKAPGFVVVIEQPGEHVLQYLQQSIGKGAIAAELGVQDRTCQLVLSADQAQVLALQKLQLPQRHR